MDYYMQYRPKRESDITDFEKEIILCMASPAYKKMIKNKFKSKKRRYSNIQRTLVCYCFMYFTWKL